MTRDAEIPKVDLPENSTKSYFENFSQTTLEDHMIPK